MTNNNNEDTKKRNRKTREDRILLIAIALPIVAMVLIGGGAALWNAVVTVFKLLELNLYSILFIVWVVIIAFLVGRKTKK